MAVAINAFGKILACGILAVATTAFAPAPKTLQAAPVAVADNSLCIDSMETVPDSDDLQAMPIADKTNGACQLPSEPVAV
ncbi:MAG TPA: hypothetical protein VGC16_01670 [Rhizomicrobium sp.]